MMDGGLPAHGTIRQTRKTGALLTTRRDMEHWNQPMQNVYPTRLSIETHQPATASYIHIPFAIYILTADCGSAEKCGQIFSPFFKKRRLAIFIDGKNKNLSMTGALHFSVYTVRKIQPNDRMRAEKEEEGKRYHSQGMAMYKKGERERKEGQISEMIREFINRKRRAVRQPPTRVDMTFEKRIIAKPLLLLLSSSSSSLYTIYDI